MLQAGQQSGLPLGVVPHNSGAARATRARVASCNDDVVTVGHLDTTSMAAMKYKLVLQSNYSVFIFAYRVSYANVNPAVVVEDVDDKSSVDRWAALSHPPRRRTPPG